MDIDSLITKYAEQIKHIHTAGTEGDYTWEGLLSSFLREVDPNL